jgi:lactate permease
LPFFSVLVPFWLVWAMAGWRGMRQVWPACLTAGLSFGIVQFLVSNYHGPWIVDIAGALVSIFSLIVLLKFWRPRTVWRFADEREEARSDAATQTHGDEYSPPSAVPRSPSKYTTREAVMAWMPWIILSVLVFLWGLPQIKAWLNGISMMEFHVPYLDKLIFRAPPVVPQPKAEEAIFVFNWLSATGTSLLLTGILSGLLLGLRPLQLARLFGKTLWRVRWSLLTIAAMLALGFNTRFGGLDATMGLAFASTGFLFPFFSPLLGWLGVALTGSDTSSNVLFGNLQQITAEQLGFSPVLAAAANSSGGVMGKMIDAQSIVVASAATQQAGNEAAIFKAVFKHSIVLAALVGLIVMLYAFVIPWIIPG